MKYAPTRLILIAMTFLSQQALAQGTENAIATGLFLLSILILLGLILAFFILRTLYRRLLVWEIVQSKKASFFNRFYNLHLRHCLAFS